MPSNYDRMLPLLTPNLLWTQLDRALDLTKEARILVVNGDEWTGEFKFVPISALGGLPALPPTTTDFGAEWLTKADLTQALNDFGLNTTILNELLASGTAGRYVLACETPQQVRDYIGASSGGGGAAGVSAPTQGLVNGTSVILGASGPDVTICTPGLSLTVTTSTLNATLERTLIIESTGIDVPLTFPVGWRWLGLSSGTGPAVRPANKVGVITIYSIGTTDAEVIASWDVQM